MIGCPTYRATLGKCDGKRYIHFSNEKNNCAADLTAREARAIAKRLRKLALDLELLESRDRPLARVSRNLIKKDKLYFSKAMNEAMKVLPKWAPGTYGGSKK